MEQHTAIHEARLQIQIHYTEMPGLCLSESQVARLLGIPQEKCAEALSNLVRDRFLKRVADGAFVRGG